MKAIKCFITLKTVIINDVTMQIEPQLSVDEFADDVALFRSQSEEINEQWIKGFGTKLFQRIFTGEALEKYQSTHPKTIALSVSDELIGLPWELLHDGLDWVARTRGIARIATISRSSPQIIPKHGALKVLAGIAGPVLDERFSADDPNQVYPIKVNAHADIFRQLSGEPFLAEIKIRKHITREILAREVSENYHIFHFVSHGNIGRLAFETRHASVDLAEESWIREQITSALRGNLRLVVVNSCHSAEDDEETHGIASTILRAGVPAVIAMQGSISELADLAFARILYGSIARGKSVDEAMMIARRALAVDQEIMPYEWALPILFVNDSLISEEASLEIMDAEMAEMIPDPKVRIVFPAQAELDPMMTREQSFAGRRQELNEVLRSLDPERRDSVQAVCFHGEGGIGKTAIAIEATERMVEWFSEIIWLSGRKAPPKELREHIKGDDPLARITGAEGFLMALATKCGLEIKGDESLAQIRDGILRNLSAGRRKLLVLDSLEELIKSDEVRSFISNFPDNCKALITSRDTLEANEKQIHLEVLKKHDCISLIRAYGKLKDFQPDSKQIEDIIHFTGGHPMTIKLVMSQVAYGERTLATTVKDLRKAKGVVFDYVFDRSLKLALKDGRRVFSAMALFRPTASRKALQEVCSLNEDDFGKAIKRLVGLSLVEHYQQVDRFGLHQLALAKAEQLLADDSDSEKYRERMAGYFVEFLKATTPMTDPATATQAIEAQLPEGTPKDQIREAAIQVLVKPALEMLKTELENCFIVLNQLLDKGDLETVTSLFVNMTGFLILRGYWRITEHFLKTIAGHWRERGDYHLEVVSLVILGMLCQRQARWKDAQDYFGKALALAQQLQNIGLEATIQNSLGILYTEQKKWNEAIEHLEKARLAFEDLNDEEGKASVLGDLGVLFQKVNQLDDAICCFEASGEIYRNNDVMDGEANSLNGLAMCYVRKGWYDDAIKHYEQALKIYTDLSYRQGQINVMNNLGVAYQIMGQLNKAIEYYDDSLRIAREVGDVNNQRGILSNIALIYSTEKNWQKASDACAESFHIAMQIHSSVVMDCLRNILKITKAMLKSGEIEAPVKLIYQLSILVQEVQIPDDEMRTALAISQGVFTIIGFVAGCGWDTASDMYKEALELAGSLDGTTGSALELVKWLEEDTAGDEETQKDG